MPMDNILNSLSNSLKGRSSQSLVRQVTDLIREQIIKGSWKPGTQLPSEDELCKALNVSRGTLRNALNNLDMEGIIVRLHGVGTFVREKQALKNNLNLLQGTTETIKSMGLTPGIAHISISQESANTEVATRLGRREGVSTIKIERIQTANERKVVFSSDYFCTSILNSFPGGPPPASQLQWYVLDNLSLFTLIEEGLGYMIHHSLMEIRPINAPEKISKLLEIPSDTAIMFVEQVGYDIEEQPLLYSIMYCTAEMSVFSINRQR
jgi:GntR family transcriptional regulator